MDLYLAIKTSNYLKVVEILNKLNHVENDCFDGKVTFISLAVLNGNQNILEKLIEKGFDVNRLSFIEYNWPKENQSFKSFEPALITATRNGDLNLCRVLLKNNAKVNKTDSFSMSALHWASSLNLIEIVEILFEYNANPNILDLKNQTPIEKAIFNQHKKIVELFDEKCSLQFRYRDYLIAAIETSNSDVFKILLKQINQRKVVFDLNLIDDSVGSLLHYAVILCNLENIKNGIPLQTTRDLNVKSFLDSPLSKVKIIEALIDMGIGINLANKLGETPLHMCRNIKVARLLLDKGALMDPKEVTGKIPMYTFLLRSNYDLMIEMIKNGCDLDTKDRLGNSLLYTIINSNAPLKLILLLLEAGVGLQEEWIKRKQYPKSIQKYPKLVSAIEWRLKNPSSLKELARKSLRTHLNKINRSKSILNSVLKLEKYLPRSLQDYILLNLNKLESVLIK